jgi:putative acetyltransferase
MSISCASRRASAAAASRALVDEAKRRAPGVVDLEVNIANLRARRFYEREGFLVVGVGTSPVSALPTLRLRWRAGEG